MEQIEQLIEAIDRGDYSTNTLPDNEVCVSCSTSRIFAIVQYDSYKSEYDDSFRHEFGIHTVVVRKTEYEMLSFHLEDEEGGEVVFNKDQFSRLELSLKQVMIDLETTE